MTGRALAILTVKDEGAFLLEWVAHHRAIGFTDILALSNDCSDGTDRMLDRLEAMGMLTHVTNPGPFPKGPQWAALARAERHPLTAAADWVMVLDIDEFVNIRAGDGTLAALFAACPGATAFALNWRMFGNGGAVEFEDRPVTEGFLRAAPRVMGWPWRAQLIKTLFRNDGSYGRLGVHRPRQPDPARIGAQVWVSGAGDRLPPRYARAGLFPPLLRDNYRIAQINHYALGAMDSFVVKCARGRANRDTAAHDMAYWVERNFDSEEDQSIARHAPRSAPLLAALHADPDLSRLHAAAVDWRRARFAELMRDEAWRSLFGRLLLAPASRPIGGRGAAILDAHARAAAAVAGAGSTGGA